MTTATVAPSKAGKPAKFRRDHRINWWLTAAVAVLSLTILVGVLTIVFNAVVDILYAVIDPKIRY